ncbi:ABC transporter ATP-binding protein [Pseudolabrys taiwanensis]|uniref:ABC transporter ATP-binding protein n=1 Tax=Pseudolabrys taiwanensis TaxID=331696 RepID=A0A345ZWB3_9HYPH|nr:ABC transporter ATP-binding protein [Pseudolabrys taiwanensis]AXK81210.1 ABC transporter ATP-binding protein [Pseudolabrys taiwanensis]
MKANVVPIFPEPPPAAAEAPSRALLRLAGISKVFANGTVALDNVDLAIRQGEFLTLLGPSGCGKSTLLKMVAGLGGPSTGMIDWPQSSYDALGEPERLLGYVFQEPTLLPWCSVFDNVYLPLKLAGQRKEAVRERIMAVLAQVGLARFAQHYPRELSGGMKMRVSIARALVTNPKILLMDEPFAALDEITRTKLNNDLLKLFAKQNLTVIFVTHSVYESVYLSSRIVIMSARPGRVSSEIAIDMPYPRDEEFRTSTVYNDYCRRASEALHRAMAESPAEPE